LTKLYSQANERRGLACKYYQVLSYVRSLNNDPIVTYDLPIDLDIIITNPPKATLRKLNWLVEGDDPTYVAYISRIDGRTGLPIIVQEFARIDLPYIMEDSGVQVFRVMDVKGETSSPIMYICKLSPWRDPPINVTLPALEIISSDVIEPNITEYSFLNAKPPSHR
jgi:hypothetical protein